LIGAGASIFQRDFDRKHRATFGCVRGGQCSAVLGDDAVRERQPNAMAFGLRREERNKNLL
jgi:hypothetical protein